MINRWLAGGAAALAGLTACASVAQAPSRWTAEDIRALDAQIQRSAADGLDPDDYRSPTLAGAASAAPAIDATADAAALKLAHDFNEGATPAALRSGWHIARAPFDYRAWLDGALAAHRLGASFEALLPTAPAYAALRSAFAQCSATAGDCRVLRVNLDRWRALPRELGPRYLWVNVPAFRLDLVEGGEVKSSHRIIVGRPGKSTPVFKADVIAVTVNPWWNVPSSIVAQEIGKLVRNHPREAARRGYVIARGSNGRLTVRQRPGPNNALGRIKLEMPNPYSVYIHDTPSKQLFAEDSRAFSHGCIRTQDPEGLAADLLGPEAAGQISLLLTTGATKTLKLRAPLPVYVVYFTAEPDPAAPDRVSFHPDLYQLDGERPDGR